MIIDFKIGNNQIIPKIMENIFIVLSLILHLRVMRNRITFILIDQIKMILPLESKSLRVKIFSSIYIVEIVLEIQL